MALDTSAYERSRRSINSGYQANTAANEYGRFVATQRTSRDVGNQSRQFKKGWGQNASAWGRRGQTGSNVNSGFYQRAMQDYAGDYQRQSNQTQQNYAAEMTQFDQNATRMQAEQQQALAELEMDKQRQIAMLAQNIQAIRPGIGG